MNYRHIYHAGNFADVFKHLVLIGLSQSLSIKENPYCFLDIHAGAGLYDLHSIEAQKTLEFKKGVEIFVNSKINLNNINASNINANNIKVTDLNESIHQSQKIINTYKNILNKFDYPHFYPGSPLIMHECLRKQDSLILVEKHVEAFDHLKSVFKNINPKFNEEINFTQNISIHKEDGYFALKAFLPPKEKRGLILIDPPFEVLDEWQKILDGITIALKRFSNGVYAIWYPIKNKKMVNDFLLKIKELNCPKVLKAELCIYPEDIEVGLNGCGIIIINTPWQFNHTLEILLPFLWNLFSYENNGYYSVQDL